MLIIFLLGLMLVAILFCVVLYNSLIAKKNQVANAFGAIDAVLKKRYDLIPNLVDSVKQYMQHERSILTEITELRTRATSRGSTDAETLAINDKLSKAIGGLMVAVENYPTLKANENFLQLQAALNEVEEQISAARRTYNAAVTEFNNGVEMFPSSIFAKMLNYQRMQVLETAAAERANVAVGKLFENK